VQARSEQAILFLIHKKAVFKHLHTNILPNVVETVKGHGNPTHHAPKGGHNSPPCLKGQGHSCAVLR
jgi:hypothetical protein